MVYKRRFTKIASACLKKLMFSFQNSLTWFIFMLAGFKLWPLESLLVIFRYPFEIIVVELGQTHRALFRISVSTILVHFYIYG